MDRYKLEYRGYTIETKGDFGSPFLIDGMPCSSGYVVVQNGCNATPGAGWYQTVAEAKLGIDCLLLSAGDATAFHTHFRAARAAAQAAVEAYLARSQP